MVYPSAWVVDVRKNLFAKLMRYVSMVPYTQNTPVIFTNRAAEWKTDGNVCPFIITDLPMPQTPPAYDRQADDITRTLMTFYKSIIPKKTSALVNVILFEVELLDRRSEVHVVFSSDPTTLPTPITTYRKSDCQYRTVRTRQHISNALNEESFWQDECLSATTSSDEEIGSRLSAQMKENLDQKLRLFEEKETESEVTHGIIFQEAAGDDMWPDNEILFVLVEHDLPPLPEGTESLTFDMVRDILDYVKAKAVQNGLQKFYAVCSIQGMSKKEPEVHLMFSMYSEPWEATTALGYPSIHVTKSDLPTLTAAEDAGSPTTDAGDQEMLPSEGIRKDPLYNNLYAKLRSYDAIDSLPPGTAVIFNREKYFWPEGVNYYVIEHVQHELPPLPSEDEYNYEEKDIEQTVLNVFDRVKADLHHYLSRIYASTFKCGEGASAEIHVLITECPEVMNMTSRMGLPSHTPTPKDPTEIPAEYRYYSVKELVLLVTYETAYAIIKREAGRPAVTEVTGSDLQLEDDAIKVDEKDLKLRQIKMRLGHRLRKHLSRYIQVFKNRPADRRDSAVVFTDDPNLWDAATNPIIKIGQLPPFPSYYDHEKFDIVSDMAEYIVRKTASDLAEEPLNLTTLTSGAKHLAQVHFYLSPSKEKPSYRRFTVQPVPRGLEETFYDLHIRKSSVETPSMKRRRSGSQSRDLPPTTRSSTSQSKEISQPSSSKMKDTKKSKTPKKK